jgi:predicted ArsR family transcriptional regulator
MNQIAPNSDQGGKTRQALLRALLRNKVGASVEELASHLAISRTAVRQHLSSLERDGLVTRGRTQSSGGRPEQLYILTEDGNERFPRQYSWFSELLLQLLEQTSSGALEEKLAELGRGTAESLLPRLAGKTGEQRIAAIAAIMQEIGYDAHALSENGEPLIEAHNCVFHKLAAKCPEVCSFDLAMLSACSGQAVEHASCMVRGGDACRFRFGAPANPSAPPE